MGLVSKEIVVLRLWEIKVYTVIPNDENLQALEHFSDQPNVKEPSSETLLRLAELIAQNSATYPGLSLRRWR